MTFRLLVIPAAVALFATGCAAGRSQVFPDPAEQVSPPPALSLQGENPAGSPTADAAAGLSPADVDAKELTMATALGLSLRHNPSLAGFSAEIRAREAAAIQTGLRANPELDLEVENFAGSDDLQGFDGAETTIALSQLVELGGKRGKRRQVAVLDTALAEWDYRSTRLDVLAATAGAFIEVLIAQEQVSLNRELLRLAEQTTVAVSEKVEAGKVPHIEKSRARVELAAARSEAARSLRALEAARKRLAHFWGAEQAGFDRVVGDLDTFSEPPSEESLRTFLKNNPDLARWETEIERSEASLSLARSGAVPDLTLSAGVRNFRETDGSALLFGISVPIPFFDRNQGAISEARARLGKAESDHRAARVSLLTTLSETWQSLSAAYVEAATLRNDILPGAQEAYESSEFGYREGKFDFLQMLDAQRTLFTVKRRYLESLGAYHLASTEMERIIGMPLADLPETTTKTAK